MFKSYYKIFQASLFLTAIISPFQMFGQEQQIIVAISVHETRHAESSFTLRHIITGLKTDELSKSDVGVAVDDRSRTSRQTIAVELA